MFWECNFYSVASEVGIFLNSQISLEEMIHLLQMKPLLFFSLFKSYWRKFGTFILLQNDAKNYEIHTVHKH